jgi:hypothetical protein
VHSTVPRLASPIERTLASLLESESQSNALASESQTVSVSASPPSTSPPPTAAAALFPTFLPAFFRRPPAKRVSFCFVSLRLSWPGFPRLIRSFLFFLPFCLSTFFAASASSRSFFAWRSASFFCCRICFSSAAFLRSCVCADAGCRSRVQVQQVWGAQRV